ncbi:glycosyl hydrolase [Tothia fuscella]|uniref:Glycosyl hydrolase n=1 Tax=Tothia fuscella TaxID=1048955 RepID=A0A9P4U154_9PEZI|nr:glycosyl hydrolase [Tothia fuscella]
MSKHGFEFGERQPPVDFSRDIPLTSQSTRNPFDTPQQEPVPRRSSKSYFPSPSLRPEDSSTSIRTSNPEKYGGSFDENGKHRFKSYRLRGEYEKSWVKDPKMRKGRIGNWVLRVFVIIGFALCAYINYYAYAGVAKHEYCLVFEDNFQTLDKNVWQSQVQIDGFGTGSFDWTTTDSKNAYVDEMGLHIVPTLTNETTKFTNEQIYHGTNLNLTKLEGDGSCTSTATISCAIRSNSTLGTMIPPVRSARLITKGKKTIKYGRVEVTAKLPVGDWLWPAIWMMPEKSVYGEWPRSGEIDIMESRGNGYNYPEGGKDWYTSTLHWGPSWANDRYWKTTYGRNLRRSDFTKEFNTFGLEWSEDYIFTYLNSRLVQTLYTGFKKDLTMWKLGEFENGVAENKTLLANPWANTTTHNAPFDQDFYLILNVAVGARNGWFLDKKGNKTWLDAGASAQWDFYREAGTWLPTWGEGDKRGMTVKSVKMWQQGKC